MRKKKSFNSEYYNESNNAPNKSSVDTRIVAREVIENTEIAKSNWFVASTMKIAKSLQFFLTALLLIDIAYVATCLVYGVDWKYFYVFLSILLLEIGGFVFLFLRNFNLYNKGILLLFDLLFALPLVVLTLEYNAHSFQLFLILAIVRLIMIILLIPVSLAKISYNSRGKKYVQQSQNASETKYYYKTKKSFYRFWSNVLCALFLVVSLGALVFVNAGSGNLPSLSRRVTYEYDEENATCYVEKVFFGFAKLEIPNECIKLNSKGVPTKYKVIGIKDYAFKNYLGDKVTLPETMYDVGQLAFADCNVSEITVLSSKCNFNNCLSFPSITVLKLENGVIESDFNAEYVHHKMSILVKEETINEYRQKYNDISDRFVPAITDDKLFVNFNNTSFDTLINLKDGNGQIIVNDPFNGTNDYIREENGREYQYVWFNRKTDDSVEKVTFPYTTSESVNLYAHWVPIYTVDYIMDSNASADSLTNKFYFTMGDVNLPDASLDGYTFMGWYLNEDFSGDKTLSIKDTTENDVKLYAKFLKNYNISYDFCYSTDDGSDYTKLYHRENQNITLPSPQRRGYNFGGWYEDSSFNTKIDTIVCSEERDISLYAKWDIITYNITYVDADIVSGVNTNVLNYTVETDDIILDSSFMVSGYNFEGWYSDSKFDSSTLISSVAIPKGSIGDKTFYAKWTLNAPIVDNEQGYSGIYDGNLHSLSVTPSHLAPSEKEITYKYKWYFNESAVTENTEKPNYYVLNVLQSGTYVCYVTAYDGKYVSSPTLSKEISVDIQKADYDMSGIAFEDAVFTYDGKEHRPEISGTLPKGYDGYEVLLSYDKSIVNVLESGTVTTVTFRTLSENYNTPSPMTATTTILPKEIVIDWCDDDFTFNGSIQNIVASYKDVNDESIDLTVSIDKEFKNYDENGYTAEVSFKFDETNYALPTVFTKDYAIKKLSIENAEITLGNSLTFNNTLQTQTVEKVIINGLDVSYDIFEESDKGSDAATYTLTVQGNGNFTGNASIDFSIAPKNINGAEIVLDGSLIYNGETQYQNINSVTIDGLVVNTYNIIKNEGVNATSYDLVVEGYDNFTGTASTKFQISPRDINDAQIVLGSQLIYANKELTQDVASVTVEGLTVTYDIVEGTNKGTDATTYTLVINGKDNFTGSASIGFTILPKDISNAEITLGNTLTYNGDNQTQEVTKVTIDGLDVTTYKVSDNIGKDAIGYTLTVTGEKNFTGIATKDFTVLPKNISNAIITLGDKLTYTGSELTQEITSVTVDGLTVTYDIVEGTNKGTDAITYTLRIKGKDNFTGNASIDFTILPKDILGATINLGESLTYTGSELTQEIESVILNGLTVTYDIVEGTNKGTDATTYVLVINGKGNYTGTTSVKFTILPKDISDAIITLDNELTYVGSELTQKIASVTLNGLTVTYDIVEGTNKGIDANTYTLKINGKGNYTGSATQNFTIKQRDISKAVITLGEKLTYTGSELTQEITNVTLNGLPITYDIVENTNKGIDAKTYTLVINGKGNYTGSASIGFTIAPKDISDAVITLGESLIYTGSELTQEIESVILNGLTVTYDVVDNSNKGTDATTYTLKISGNGNFTGSTSIGFTIAPKDIADATITLGNKLTYTGSELTQDITSVILNGLTVTYDIVENTNKGTDANTYTLVIKGKGNYTGSATQSFTIAPKDIEDATITLGESLTYTGSVLTQEITNVTLNGLTVTYDIVEGTNEGTDANTYTLVIKGKGNFTGSATQSFTIAPKDIEDATITLGESLTYTGSVLTQEITDVTLDGLTVTYDIVAGTNEGTDANTYTLVIKGKGNFTGSATQDFTIKQRDISKAVITLGESLIYTGSELTQEIVDVTLDGLNVTYDIVDGTNKGTDAKTYTLVIEGNSNFTGRASIDFTIAKKNIESAEITLGLNPVYNGKQQTVSIENVTVDGLTVDYKIVQGNSGTDVNTYELVIEGINNFEGTKTVSWEITPLNIENSAIQLTVDRISYTGNEITNEIISVVTPNGVKLSSKDYSVDGLIATNAGIYTVTITATSENITGVATTSYEIVPLNIADAQTIELETNTFTYDGNEKTVIVKKVVVGGIELVLDTDYTVSGNIETEVGEYFITIEGKDNFYGKKSIKWSIIEDETEETPDPEEPIDPSENENPNDEEDSKEETSENQ